MADKWTCPTCNRQMLHSQQQDHQAGKAHIRRLTNQNPTAGTATAHLNSQPFHPTSTSPSNSSHPAASRSIDPTNPQKKTPVPPIIKPKSRSQQNHFNQAKVRNHGKSGPGVTAAGRSSSFQPSAPSPAPAGPQHFAYSDWETDWESVGFGQMGFAAGSGSSSTRYEYGGFGSEKGENFGLCDKDCGWCGHCMDDVDI